ncbi:UPF0721 transmembrane protein [Companilactobacillus sp. RD055328]|uniref:sulfite exporter TauE/SafE family protein n=1 Tax=Companilactobacillus sp. RD055328 TaxID=2916634 RepID=UPI001FC8923F|nr:sulfite exporter TauE/SafE family protein [Companilactobacillus sp. RD055328]GKQ42796.1 UPF0721 transmembrane protein [Companilactobacillus sp. RD055328]
MIEILIALIILINIIFAFYFVRDLIKNRTEVMKENASTLWLPFSSFVIFFLSTFGISDFAISTAIYTKFNWTKSIKQLTGTLNTQCVVPLMVMALCYLSAITVDIKTLVICIISAVIGAYIGPKFVLKLPIKTIKYFVTMGLIIASLLILAGKFNIISSHGTATELHGYKLLITAILLFIFGALNNIGIGSFALTMATVYIMGLNPSAAFPIMMGSAAFSITVGSIQFVKLQSYSRKISLFSSIFGVLGVLVAVFFVKSLNTSMLQWLVIVVLVYTAISMFMSIQEDTKFNK